MKLDLKRIEEFPARRAIHAGHSTWHLLDIFLGNIHPDPATLHIRLLARPVRTFQDGRLFLPDLPHRYCHHL